MDPEATPSPICGKPIKRSRSGLLCVKDHLEGSTQPPVSLSFQLLLPRIPHHPQLLQSLSHLLSDAYTWCCGSHGPATPDQAGTVARAADENDDCNLTALCDHIQTEGFNSGAFSDMVVHAMGSTYHLHPNLYPTPDTTPNPIPTPSSSSLFYLLIFSFFSDHQWSQTRSRIVFAGYIRSMVQFSCQAVQTIDECFERRLFGLPSSQDQFVKQIKTGMILFLFEFERRELHGVFQACSDGEMNISPSAYKFIRKAVSCSEPEFSGAIKDNYFSNWKFRFGLSKAQVRRLLLLFSSRKLKYQRRQRQLASRREPISVDTAGRVKEVDDGKNIGKEDGGMLASDEVGNLHEVDKKVGKIMQRVYLGPVPGEVGKLDAAFAMSEKAGNEFNVDVESVSSEHPMSDQSGRVDDDLNIGKLYSDVPHPPSPLSSPPSAGPRSLSAVISSPLPAEAGGLQRGADGDI
ncbi:hypothetical protein FF1_046313 [Malus domestica]